MVRNVCALHFREGGNVSFLGGFSDHHAIRDFTMGCCSIRITLLVYSITFKLFFCVLGVGFLSLVDLISIVSHLHEGEVISMGFILILFNVFFVMGVVEDIS